MLTRQKWGDGGEKVIGNLEDSTAQKMLSGRGRWMQISVWK